MFGFAGQISALSGTNKAGLSAFQHVLQGVSGRPTTGKKFEPIWFSLRKALERKDYNGDTKNNTEDIRAILSSNTNGYATSCIISSAAPSTNVSDSLIALVSEVTFVAPTHTFRTNSYADSIPGDNLYAANSPIKRLDARAYCTRYLGVVGAIGAGVNVDTSMNWRVLRDYSRVVGSNVQFIQVIPELHTLQLSVYQNSSPAYYNTPRKYDTDTLFVKPQAVSDRPELTTSDFILYQNYPNPFNPFTNIQYQLNEPRKVTLTVFDGLGNEIAVLVNAEQPRGVYSIPFSAVGLPSGNYFYRLTVGNFSTVRKFVLMK
jgi:hypothetical protein